MKRNLAKKFAFLTVVLSLVGGVALAPGSMAATPDRYITISADGTVKVSPDAVRLDATVSVVADSNAQALKATSAASAAVRAALIASKISTKDIATRSVTVYPEYNYTQDKGSLLIGYRGTQSFSVTIRSAKNAGAIIDSVVGAGGDALQINGVTPFIVDPTKASASARADAVKRAKAKAISYASLMGVKLSRVNFLVENSAPNSYPPMMAMAKSDAGATVIDLGQQDVSVSITIQWALA